MRTKQIGRGDLASKLISPRPGRQPSARSARSAMAFSFYADQRSIGMKRFSMGFGRASAVLSLLAVAAGVHAGERPIVGAGSGALNYVSARLVGGGNVSHLGTCSMSINLISLDQG